MKTTRIITSIIVIILLIPCLGFAQDDEEPNTVLCVKYAFNTDNEEGSVAEFDSIYALNDKYVTKKNKYIKMKIRVSHYYGSDSDDFLSITEYNGSGLDIIEKAIKENTRLYKEWKTDEKDRKAFNELFYKYFKAGHSDEIYALLSKVIN